MLIQHPTVHLKTRVSIESFFDTEALGVECTPKCGSCRCGRCPIGGKSYTLKEQRELRLIEEGLKHKDDHRGAQYPWIRDPKQLPDNKEFASRKLKATEKRLKEDEALLRRYEEQIDDMIRRGVARKLTKEELDEYTSPVHYLSHHEMINQNQHQRNTLQNRFQLICQMQWVLIERLLGKGTRLDEQLTWNNDQASRGTGCISWGYSKNVPFD